MVVVEREIFVKRKAFPVIEPKGLINLIQQPRGRCGLVVSAYGWGAEGPGFES